MSVRTDVHDTPRWPRLLLAAGAVGVIALSVTVLLRWTADQDQDLDDQARPIQSADAASSAMAGMNMGGDGSIQLTADQLRTFGVTFGTVDVRRLEDVVRTVGIVTLDETRIASVTPRFSGYVEALYVDFTGRPVVQGELLVEIYSPELVAAQEELLLAARLEEELFSTVIPGVPSDSSTLVASARQRLRSWDIAEEQIDAILATGRATRTLALHAPITGVVIEKNVVAGQAVEAGESLYTIADLSEVWVEAELREADAGLVREGDPATVELSAFPGRPIAGRVEYVYPTLQEQARTLKARIAIQNPDGLLKPGMYATVRLQPPGRTTLTVPASAILDTGERRVVFVDLGEGRMRPEDVEVGRLSGDLAEILAGLEPGQRVVTSAQYLLDSESNVGEVMRSMIGVMNMSDMGSMGAMDVQSPDMNGMIMPQSEP